MSYSTSLRSTLPLSLFLPLPGPQVSLLSLSVSLFFLLTLILTPSLPPQHDSQFFSYLLSFIFLLPLFPSQKIPPPWSPQQQQSTNYPPGDRNDEPRDRERPCLGGIYVSLSFLHSFIHSLFLLFDRVGIYVSLSFIHSFFCQENSVVVKYCNTAILQYYIT